MPDWSYEPFLKPLLFALPADEARRVTLSSMAALAKIPGGTNLIDLLGHMSPPKAAGVEICGIILPSLVGLGAGIDPEGHALIAFERFGFGFIELGPASACCKNNETVLRSRDTRLNALLTCNSSPRASLETVVSNLSDFRSRHHSRTVAVSVRVGHELGIDPAVAAPEAFHAIEALKAIADWIVLDTRWLSGENKIADWKGYLTLIKQKLSSVNSSVPLFVAVNPEIDSSVIIELVSAAVSDINISGVAIAGGLPYDNDKRIYGEPTHGASIDLVGQIRDHFGENLIIIGSGGIIQPSDAIDFLDSGANLVQLNSGMVFGGPGLPKRINEAVEARAYQSQPIALTKPNPLTQGWFYSCSLGIGMLISGILAWILGMTRVILPYDEQFLHLDRAGIDRINPHILHFMMHDRVTLASTMISVAIVYIGLSLFGIRKGDHWAWKALHTSAGVGFASFFLFLGFGYFDSLHALVCLILFPFFLAGLILKPTIREVTPPLSLHNDSDWRHGMIGQLLLVMVGVGLVLAGVTISMVGITHIFVPSDLQFLGTTPEILRNANAHLLPVIAHDRAGFGGCLASNGVGVLLTVLWGIRSGAKWLWWTLALAAFVGYFGVFMIHMMIGYMNPIHVGPAWLAFLLTALGLGFCYPFMCGSSKVEISPLRSE